MSFAPASPRIHEATDFLEPETKHESQSATAGFGSCKVCGCLRYLRGSRDGICQCQHHWNMHRYAG